MVFEYCYECMLYFSFRIPPEDENDYYDEYKEQINPMKMKR